MLSKKKLAIITIFASLAIAFIGYGFYQNLAKSIRTEREIDLTAIAQLKINEIEQWIQERTADIKVLSGSYYFAEAVSQSIKSPDNTNLKAHLQERINLIQNQYRYHSVLILSPDNKILFTTNNAPYHIEPDISEKIKTVIDSKVILHSGFYFCNTEKTIHYDLIAPIVFENEVIATLILRVDPTQYLYPLIQSWPTPSKTAETLLIRKENDYVLFLNELRHQKGTALKLKITEKQKDLPAVMAADGMKGIVIGNDYRGKEVVAYIAPIPGSNWFMVAKIDKAELFKEVISQGKVILLATFLIIICIAIGLAYYYTLKQKQAYRTLFETQEEYKTTLYSIGDAVITTDQHGVIKHFNKIAEELSGWKEEEVFNAPLKQVFKIINEDSREPVENPVEKVLQNGKIVGLANHTLLISKDGKETPIADSAAPIRNSEGEIIGVVLVFRDQIEERRHFEEIKASRDFAEGIIETLHESLLVLDKDFKIISANHTFLETFGFEKNEVLGLNLFELGDYAWNTGELREQLEKILPQNTKFDAYEVSFDFENIGTRILSFNARRIYASDKKTKYILLAINDITEKNNLIEELTIARKKAEDSNNLKSAFLANMSHEIRTPLNGIIGFSSMLIDESLNKEDKDRFYKIIESSGERLLSLVNDILDISMIQSNQLKISPSNFKILEFLEETYTFYSNLKIHNSSQLELRCDFDSEEKNLEIKTDKHRLFQILKNLLDNSFKFTTEGFIHFGAIHLDGHIRFYVKDSGEGIPEDQINVIFDKFQRVNSHNWQNKEGTGLGLAIAKGLISQMGGEIWVESEVGKGTEFYFTLPIGHSIN